MNVHADLYHRALTGRGAPLSSEEVLELLKDLEEAFSEVEDAEAPAGKAERELEQAWIVPKEEPHRPCGICGPGHDRGDGRCEHHGRYCGSLDEGEPNSPTWRLARQLEAEKATTERLLAEVKRLREEVAKAILNVEAELSSRASRADQRTTGQADQRRSGGPRDQILDPVTARVGGDDEHGVLTELTCEPPSHGLGALEDDAAAPVLRRREHLHHDPVLASALPDAARPEEGGVREHVRDQALDGGAERGRIELERKLLVASGGTGDAGADVQADRAARLGVAPRARRAGAGVATKAAGGTARHETSVAEDRLALKDRAGRRRGTFWLFADRSARIGYVRLETSWLPDLPEIRRELAPLGFDRASDGTYRVYVESGDELGLRRAMMRAYEVMEREAGR